MSFDLPGVKQSSDIETLFKIVGFVVVQWGHNEQCLDLIVAAIFLRFDGHPLLTRRPVNLESKIKFLQECFVKIPELEQCRAEIEAILLRFAATGKIRNDLVHAAISETSIENGSFTFAKIDVKPKDSHSIRPFVLDDTNWPAFREELLDLERDAVALARKVWNSLKVQT